MEILQLDIVTGRKTTIAAGARRALRALRRARVRFAVIGATALAVRGLPRMTKDLDLIVTTDDAWQAVGALERTGFRSAAPVDRDDAPEAMYVLTLGDAQVDLLIVPGEPESTVLAEAPVARVFGVEAPVATLEHLVLMYLYSNQVRHQGDLARIVLETTADLGAVEAYLGDVHPEMIPLLRQRVEAARHPPAPPRRPAPRRKT